MKKKILLVFCCLLCVTNFFGLENQTKFTTIELDEFSNIDLSVIAADVYLVTGDNYSVSYDLHEKEKVERAEVKNNIFYFNTALDYRWKMDFGDWNVIITVPENAHLEKIKIKTVAGDIIDSNRDYFESELNTTSGQIHLKNVNAKEIEGETVSGEISFENCNVENLSVKNTSGDIFADGHFVEVEINSTSGDIELNGKVDEEGELETVSGSIHIFVPNSSVEAKSFGRVYLNGDKKKNNFYLGRGESLIKAKSVSGRITIN